MKAYKKLIKDVLSAGQERPCRNSEGAISVFGATLKVDLAKGFPIVTSRRIAYKQGIAELVAFLRGCSLSEDFSKLGCTYWNKYGPDLGPVYGYQWRHWGEDQLVNLVAKLKSEPFSRRHILSTWNWGDIDKMVLPPCHMMAQFYVDAKQKRLDCIVYMRSVDIMLGLPFDIIVYALLTELLAKECGYKAGSLRFFFGDAHIYKEHAPSAFIVANAESFVLPSLDISKVESIFTVEPDQVVVNNYFSADTTVNLKLFL